MGVYFVYRCPYNGPTEKYVKRFDDATVLDWFRRIWVPVAGDAAWSQAEELLGADVYGFGALFLWVHESGTPLPATIEEAMVGVGAKYHGPIRHEEHCVQMMTDDDEVTMCWHLFDDVFLTEHRDLAAFLLYEGERLPDGAGPAGWEPVAELSEGIQPAGASCGQCCSGWLFPWAGCGLAGLGPDNVSRHRGLRLIDISTTLMTAETRQLNYLWADVRVQLFGVDVVADGVEKGFVRSIQEAPADAVNWMVYSDWLAEQGRPPAGLRLLEAALSRLYGETGHRVYVGEHVAQVYINDGDGRFDQWFLFDDLWASAHPALADALLRFATRWDVLSTGNERTLG